MRSVALTFLNGTREYVLARVVGSNVLIKVAALLGPVGTVRALELRLLAALVPGVSDQSGAVLVPLATGLASIWEIDALRHPEAGQVLDQRHHRVVTVPLVALRHRHARYRWQLCKAQQEENVER